jgi:regulator of cell morphogenesis and NO signaling
MSITEQSLIGELVAKDYRTASVFKKNNIDFCCNGNRTIKEACEKDKIECNQLLDDLNNIPSASGGSTENFNSWPLDLLADYVEKKHHRYVETKTKEIIPYLDKIIRVHGGRHPELAEVGDLFKESAEDLGEHMQKEERMLFPYIREMVKAKMEQAPIQAPFGTVQNPIQMMMHEHDTEGERFRKIAALTNNYIAPEDACNTYRVTLSLLKEFEDDLHLHIHLENNILFPKSISLEKTFATA